VALARYWRRAESSLPSQAHPMVSFRRGDMSVRDRSRLAPGRFEVGLEPRRQP
jgi:hypothetical protein